MKNYLTAHVECTALYLDKNEYLQTEMKIQNFFFCKFKYYFSFII